MIYSFWLKLHMLQGSLIPTAQDSSGVRLNAPSANKKRQFDPLKFVLEYVAEATKPRQQKVEFKQTGHTPKLNVSF